MTYSQPFWDAFRIRLETGLGTWAQHCRAEHWDSETRTRRWTTMIIQSATEACADLQTLFGCELAIGGERINRLDVHAQDKTSGELLVAFESEQGLYGSKAGWEKEFEKLCQIQARLRVITGMFKVGEGKQYPQELQRKLNLHKPAFEGGKPGEFLLVLGPEFNRKDPFQPWLAYTISEDMTLTRLSPQDPFMAVLYLGPE